MKAKLHSAKMKTNFRRSLALVEGILPFAETPADDRALENKETTKNEMKANDLFSLFTADIIKEQTVFTR